jgi:hypothetical protein
MGITIIDGLRALYFYGFNRVVWDAREKRITAQYEGKTFTETGETPEIALGHALDVWPSSLNQ